MSFVINKKYKKQLFEAELENKTSDPAAATTTATTATAPAAPAASDPATKSLEGQQQSPENITNGLNNFINEYYKNIKTFVDNSWAKWPEVLTKDENISKAYQDFSNNTKNPISFDNIDTITTSLATFLNSLKTKLQQPTTLVTTQETPPTTLTPPLVANNGNINESFYTILNRNLNKKAFNRTIYNMFN